MAMEVLEQFELQDEVPLAALAKREEELFVPGKSRVDPAAGALAGAVPGAAGARRGAPLCQ